MLTNRREYFGHKIVMAAKHEAQADATPLAPQGGVDEIAAFLKLTFCEQAKAWSGTVPHTIIMSGGPDRITTIKAIIDAAGLVISVLTAHAPVVEQGGVREALIANIAQK